MINLLKKAREEKKLSLTDVSETLKIRECYLDALERGDYAQLPELVYAIGFAKSYMQFIEVKSDNLIQEIKDHAISRERFSEEDRLTGTDGELGIKYLRNKKLSVFEENKTHLLHIHENQQKEIKNPPKNDNKDKLFGVFARDLSDIQMMYVVAIILALVIVISLL